MPKIFGTDGIRGIANSYPMTAEVALQVGRDTRLSGGMLAHALVAGICSAGAEADLLGVLPTPGIAFMARAAGAQGGIVISASHNPYEDNGIKLFGPSGTKLGDESEARIEAGVLEGLKDSAAGSSAREPGRVERVDDAVERYAGFLKSCAGGGPRPFSGLKIVLDCAHGAAYQAAPRVFNELGAVVEALHVSPDGRNINAGCGSQHPERLARRVVEAQAQAGLAFDGDADRLIAVDETGEVLTGDRILAILAARLKAKGRLAANTVVSTVMSNMGLGAALKEMGVRHVTSAVGDRYVMEAMRGCGAVLGGEDSGHIIFADHHSTGDGILSGIKLLEAMTEDGRPLSELKRIMTVYPQVLINVPVRSKPAVASVPGIVAEIRRVENELGENGRVLVRYSGTEQLCRVMVEGPTEEKTGECCRRIAAAVKRELG